MEESLKERAVDPKISVIITIHNAEKYLRECLDSVINQTFGNIEVLCMDGGSTDASPQILREYAGRDCRIRIIDDTNTSYGHKVNAGILQAKGEYVSVLESDDMYEPFMLERLYEIVRLYQPDLVNGNYTNFFDINGRRFGYVTQMYEEKDYNCLINYRKEPERFGVIPRYWTGIFRRGFLLEQNIRMNESPGASFQDMSFRFLTSILAASAYHLDLPLYLYRTDNPGSSMHDSTKTIVIAEEHEFLHNELKKRSITDGHVWHNAYLWKYMDFRGNMSHLRGKYRQELFDRYLQELENDRDALKKYANQGYGQFAGEMMEEPPQRVLDLLDQDAAQEQEGRERLYRFVNVVSVMDSMQKIVVFGAGQIGRWILELLHFEKQCIGCITDNNRNLWSTDLCGHKIYPPEKAVEKYPDALYVVANKFHAQEIKQQLKDLGIQEKRIYIY